MRSNDFRKHGIWVSCCGGLCIKLRIFTRFAKVHEFVDKKNLGCIGRVMLVKVGCVTVTGFAEKPMWMDSVWAPSSHYLAGENLRP